MRRHEHTDHEWSVIKRLLPRNSQGVPRVDDPGVINGILRRFRIVSSWRGARALRPAHHALQSLHALAGSQCLRPAAGGREPAYDGDSVMIDSSCVRVHQHGAAGKKGGPADPCMGRSRGGLTTKIHALVDAEGQPVRLELTAGKAGDAPLAAKLLDAVALGAIVIADKAYYTDGIRSLIATRGA